MSNNETVSTKERAKLNPRQTKGVLLASLALTAALLPACTANAKSAEVKPTTKIEQKATATQPSAETSDTQAEKVPTVAELEISADLSPEDQAKAIVERINSLLTAGMDQETYNRWDTDFMSGKIPENTEWLEDFVQQYTEKYYTALFGENYANNPDIKNYIDRVTLKSEDHLDRFLSTTTKEGTGLEGRDIYKYEMSFDRVDARGNDLFIYIYEKDNTSTTNLGQTKAYEKEGSINLHNMISCSTETVKGTDGKDIIRITKISVAPLLN